MAELLEAIVGIYDFVTTGIWDGAEQIYAYYVQWVVVAKIKTMTWAAGFAWGVAENILVNVGLSQMINDAWGQLDSVTMSYMTFFKLPEGINILLQAHLTRFVMKVMGV